MKKLILILALMLTINLTFAQGTAPATAPAKEEEKENKLTAAIDVVYPYLWRGVKYYGDRIAFQPYINYAITKKLTLGTWGSTNLSEEANAYNEIDFSITYAVTPEIKVAASSYYWPATVANGGSRANFTDFSATSAQTLDLTIALNFTEKGYPVDFLWSTIVAGADYKDFEIDAVTGENIDGTGKKAFSSYAEIGYTWSPKKVGVDIRPFLGATINNGGYYPTNIDDDGKYQSFQIINTGVNVAKTFHLNGGYDFPMFVRYTYNDSGYANPNTIGEPMRNFFSAGMTFKIY